MTAISEPPELTHHRLHLPRLGDATVTVARYPVDGGHVDQVAVLYGSTDRDPGVGVLVRLQSSCVYGEVFGSTDCDCRDQLNLAFRRIRQEGAGVVVYLDQEGRGAGIWTKARGYSLCQRDGVDSFTAYERLGCAPDSRDYGVAARLLVDLGITRVRLLTNNPRKVGGLQAHGIEVQRVALTPRRRQYAAYLESKRRQGHLIP